MVKCIHIKNGVDGNRVPFGCSREPAVGVSRCRRTGCSGSRAGFVNTPVSNEARLPALRDRTCWSLREILFGG